jgi:hypothetical protein
MAEFVYILCTLTSVMCALLLLRSYLRTRTRLLLWSTLCFIGLAVNNVLMFVDLLVVPDVDLRVLRSGAGVIALCLLLYGLIWENP